MKVIVAQLSARHNYAIPRMLHGKGVLSKFYTDLTFSPYIGKLTRNFGVPERYAGAFSRRVVEGVPPKLIRNSYSASRKLASAALKAGRGDFQGYLELDEAFGNAMIKWGIGEANVIYGVAGSGTPFWRHARQRGLKIASDIIITPMFHRIVRDERERFPDWNDQQLPTDREIEVSDKLSLDSICCADLLICPSEGVRRDISLFAQQVGMDLSNIPPATVVNYGIKIPENITNIPVRGRVLFAGGGDIRKGVHYFARAANLLKHKDFEFLSAGGTSEKITKHPEAKNVTFLGHLSRDALYREFVKADVMVLPTLAEGSATVVHEAMACGVPVITTLSAGSVIQDGREGFIVPERDAEALASAIDKVVTNRPQRDYLATQAKATSLNFAEGPWASRIMDALALLKM
jgi:glycosyltransferase involved in cell wall biosynthesis